MVWYNGGKLRILNASHAEAIDLVADTINVALMKTSYTINIDTTGHEHFDDVSASEIVATNYVVFGGGTEAALASKAVAADDTNDRAEFDAQDLTYSNIGNGSNDTFDQIIIYKDTATASTSSLIAHATVNSTTTNGSSITLQWDAQGILQLS